MKYDYLADQQNKHTLPHEPLLIIIIGFLFWHYLFRQA